MRVNKVRLVMFRDKIKESLFWMILAALHNLMGFFLKLGIIFHLASRTCHQVNATGTEVVGFLVACPHLVHCPSSE